jgi:hypothetical protein
LNQTLENIMAAILEVSMVEKQVMDVFARCTGFFGKKPKRETERTVDMLWRSIHNAGFNYQPQEVVEAVENLVAGDLLVLNEKTGHITLTDEGYRFVCGEVDVA